MAGHTALCRAVALTRGTSLSLRPLQPFSRSPPFPCRGVLRAHVEIAILGGKRHCHKAAALGCAKGEWLDKHFKFSSNLPLAKKRHMRVGNTEACILSAMWKGIFLHQDNSLGVKSGSDKGQWSTWGHCFYHRAISQDQLYGPLGDPKWLFRRRNKALTSFLGKMWAARRTFL